MMTQIPTRTHPDEANRMKAASILTFIFVVGSIPFISMPAAEAGLDDSCYGVDSDFSRDITKSPYWDSTYGDYTIHNFFTPLKAGQDDQWQGVREYAGVCAVIESIEECLENPPHSVDKCIPE